MNSMSSMSTRQKYFTMFILALVGGSIYKVSYFKEVFYDQLKAALEISHTQMGILASVVGITASVSYLIGGFVADKIKPRMLITISSIGGGIMTVWYATLPSFTALIIIHFLLALFGMLTYWAAYIKIINQMGGENEQSKLLGISEGFRSLTGIIFPFGALAIVNAVANNAQSMQMALAYYAVIYFVAGILSFIFIKDSEESIASAKATKEDYIELFKSPGLWMVALLVFGTYSIFALQSYTTPYLTSVWKVDAGLVGALAIIRQYGIGLLAMPMFGLFADKIKSPVKGAFIGLIFLLISAIGIRFTPIGSSVPMVVLMVLAIAFFVSGVRGIYYATMKDAKIPAVLTGTAIGVISTIGFLPDAFMFTQVGRWLDKYPVEQAYMMIFNYMVLMICVALFAIFLIHRRSKQSN